MNASLSSVRTMGSRLCRAVEQPLRTLRDLRYHLDPVPSPEAHVFVVGPPRSGTTLVRQTLLAHPRLTGTDRETFFFLRWNIRDFSVEAMPEHELADIKARSASCIEIFDEIARWMKRTRDAEYFVEKSPQHALRLSFLRCYFPRSRFIFVHRDPRDCLLSAWRHRGMKKRSATKYARLWRDCVRARLREGDANEIFDLRYEDFCASPAPYLERMMSLLGYEMVPEQLLPSSYSLTSLTHEVGHGRLNEPITGKTIGQWRTALSSDLITRIERIAGPEMKALGYPIDVPVRPGGS